MIYMTNKQDQKKKKKVSLKHTTINIVTYNKNIMTYEYYHIKYACINRFFRFQEFTWLSLILNIY